MLQGTGKKDWTGRAASWYACRAGILQEPFQGREYRDAEETLMKALLQAEFGAPRKLSMLHAVRERCDCVSPGSVYASLQFSTENGRQPRGVIKSIVN